MSPEYKEVVGASITEVGGEACYKRIESAVKILEDDIENGNLERLKENINICPNFDVTNKKDVMALFGSFSDIFAGLVQTHK